VLLSLASAAIASSAESATHRSTALTTAANATSQCAAIASTLGAATRSPAESAATDATAVTGESTHLPLALCTARCNGMRLWHDGHRRAVRGRGALPCASGRKNSVAQHGTGKQRRRHCMLRMGRRASGLLRADRWRLVGALQDDGKRMHKWNSPALPARVLHHTPESAALATALAATTHVAAGATATIAAATHAATAHATVALSATAHASASVATTATGCAATRRTT